MSFVEFIKEKYNGPDHEELENEFQGNRLDDWLSLSSYEPIVHEISDPNEESLMKFLKTLLWHLVKILMVKIPLNTIHSILFQKKHL